MVLASRASLLGLGVVGFICLGFIILINHYFDACNAVNLPDVEGKFTHAECEGLLKNAINAAPKEKRMAAGELVFFFTLAARVEAAFFISTLVGTLYAATLPLEQRHPVLLPYAVWATLLFFLDANHAGLAPIGKNAFVTEKAKSAAMALMSIWTVVSPCLWWGFFASRAAAGAKAKQAFGLFGLL